MKKAIFLSLVIISFIGCIKNKSITCTCTEFYNGANTNWSIDTDTIFNNITEAEATSKCNALDGETQVILTETYGLDCELK